MDHTHYRYSALPSRPLAQDGATLRAYVVLCIEHWHALAPAGAVRDPRFVGEFGSYTPDYRSWTQREYGLRIGVWRVLDALRESGLRPAVALNAEALPRMQPLVDRLLHEGCEFVGHGLAANVLMHGGMPLPQQQDHVERSLDALARATGSRPLGWLSQDWGTTPDTHELLARAGLRYTLDWCNDDQAYRMEPRRAQGGDPLVAVPLSAEWDDVQCQWLRNLSPHAHADLALQAFDRLRAECASQRRDAVFGLSLHPWVCGMSSRIGALRSLLQALRARAGVQWCLPSAIAALASPTSHQTP